MGGVDGADAALPGGLHVDAVGEPVALQLADDLEVGRGVHDFGVDQRGAVGHHDAVDVADADLDQPADGVGVLVRAEGDAALQVQPLPVGNRGEPVEVRGQEAHVAHPLVAYDQYLVPGSLHKFS